MSDYYVYLHRKATTGEVFYVGKGKNRRSSEKLSRSNYWKRIVAKHGYVIDYAIQGVQEWYALELEKQLVDYYGRRDLDDGPLVNLCDGGAESYNMNDEIRAKMSESKRGKKLPDWVKESMSRAHKGRTFTDAHLEKLRVAGKRRGVSDDMRQKCIAAKSKPIMRSDGKIFDSCRHAARCLIDEGFITASHTNISSAARGKYEKAYGYGWQYVIDNQPQSP